jgi:hypothetical protein
MLTQTHYSDGGTFFTNFEKCDCQKILQAVFISRVDRLVISPFAYDEEGGLLETFNSIHIVGTLEPEDFNSFWAAFDSL